MGFDRKSVEEVGEKWESVIPLNDTTERLRERRNQVIKKEGLAAESKVIWKILGFREATLYRIVMLADGCISGWNNRNFLAAVLCARAMMETSALIIDFTEQLAVFVKAIDFAGIDQLVMSRTFSTKSKSWLEEGAGFEAPNVLTLLDKLDKKYKGVRGHFDRLSEICHPNSMGHYMMFASIDKETAAIKFSEDKRYENEMLNYILGGFGVIIIAESSFNKLDTLYDGILKLSNTEKE